MQAPRNYPTSTPHQGSGKILAGHKDIKEAVAEQLDIDPTSVSQSGIVPGEEGPQPNADESEDEEPSATTGLYETTEGGTQDVLSQADTGPEPHGIHSWSLVLTISWFVFGLLACAGHQKFYSDLDGAVAGNSNQQEWNLRSE
jgi:hypothetical protein